MSASARAAGQRADPVPAERDFDHVGNELAVEAEFAVKRVEPIRWQGSFNGRRFRRERLEIVHPSSLHSLRWPPPPATFNGASNSPQCPRPAKPYREATVSTARTGSGRLMAVVHLGSLFRGFAIMESGAGGVPDRGLVRVDWVQSA